MEIDLGIEVSEVTFDEFERRKAPRVSISINEIRSKDYFANDSYKGEQIRFEVDLGIEVNEIAFDQFERRKAPRENRSLNS
jgi:stalled ribosome rescue protein Dom34